MHRALAFLTICAQRTTALKLVFAGGTGGLGLLTGKWLGEIGAASLVLAARGGKVAAADAAKLKKLSKCAVRVVKCDAAELTERALGMLRTLFAPGSSMLALEEAKLARLRFNSGADARARAALEKAARAEANDMLNAEAQDTNIFTMPEGDEGGGGGEAELF